MVGYTTDDEFDYHRALYIFVPYAYLVYAL